MADPPGCTGTPTDQSRSTSTTAAQLRDHLNHLLTDVKLDWPFVQATLTMIKMVMCISDRLFPFRIVSQNVRCTVSADVAQAIEQFQKRALFEREESLTEINDMTAAMLQVFEHFQGQLHAEGLEFEHAIDQLPGLAHFQIGVPYQHLNSQGKLLVLSARRWATLMPFVFVDNHCRNRADVSNRKPRASRKVEHEVLTAFADFFYCSVFEPLMATHEREPHHPSWFSHPGLAKIHIALRDVCQHHCNLNLLIDNIQDEFMQAMKTLENMAPVYRQWFNQCDNVETTAELKAFTAQINARSYRKREVGASVSHTAVSTVPENQDGRTRETIFACSSQLECPKVIDGRTEQSPEGSVTTEFCELYSQPHEPTQSTGNVDELDLSYSPASLSQDDTESTKRSTIICDVEEGYKLEKFPSVICDVDMQHASVTSSVDPTYAEHAPGTPQPMTSSRYDESRFESKKPPSTFTKTRVEVELAEHSWRGNKSGGRDDMADPPTRRYGLEKRPSPTGSRFASNSAERVRSNTDSRAALCKLDGPITGAGQKEHLPSVSDSVVYFTKLGKGRTPMPRLDYFKSAGGVVSPDAMEPSAPESYEKAPTGIGGKRSEESGSSFSSTDDPTKSNLHHRLPTPLQPPPRSLRRTQTTPAPTELRETDSGYGLPHLLRPRTPSNPKDVEISTEESPTKTSSKARRVVRAMFGKSKSKKSSFISPTSSDAVETPQKKLSRSFPVTSVVSKFGSNDSSALQDRAASSFPPTGKKSSSFSSQGTAENPTRGVSRSSGSSSFSSNASACEILIDPCVPFLIRPDHFAEPTAGPSSLAAGLRAPAGRGIKPYSLCLSDCTEESEHGGELEMPKPAAASLAPSSKTSGNAGARGRSRRPTVSHQLPPSPLTAIPMDTPRATASFSNSTTGNFSHRTDSPTPTSEQRRANNSGSSNRGTFAAPSILHRAETTPTPEVRTHDFADNSPQPILTPGHRDPYHRSRQYSLRQQHPHNQARHHSYWQHLQQQQALHQHQQAPRRGGMERRASINRANTDWTAASRGRKHTI